MEVDADKEEGCAVGVHVSDKSSVVYVSANVGNGGKGCCDIRGVVHC